MSTGSEENGGKYKRWWKKEVNKTKEKGATQYNGHGSNNW